MVRPAPLKNRSIAVIGERDAAVLGPLYPGTRKGDVAHFVPDRDSTLARHRRARPRAVMFPRFEAGARLHCEPLDSAAAVMRLGLNSFNYRALGPLGFRAAVELARRTKAWELRYGDLDEAIACIETLFASLP